MRLAALAALVLALTLGACSKPGVAYDGVTFQAKGWRGSPPSGGWPSVFAVYAGDSPEPPPMLGDYSRRGSTIRFAPRYPPTPGVHLRAVYRPSADTVIRWDQTVTNAAPAGAAPTVVAIYPSAQVIPENQLKLYVEFSRPMQRGHAWEHLRLLDEKGAAVDNPFVEIDQELWDPQGRRLTVLFDPGRIKRGVLPNRQVGVPLVPGRRYSLVVTKGLQAADGPAMAADAVKAFSVAAAERRPILLADWLVAAPKAGGRDPLVVRLPRPMDQALLADSLQVRRGDKALAGHIEIADQETTWRFIPAAPWAAGAYDLRVETRIEDLAGNRIGRAFDVDTVADNQPRITDRFETLPFRVR